LDTKKSRDIEYESFPQIVCDRMHLIYAFDKPFMVKFPEKYEWQNRFNPDNKGGLFWYTDESKTNKGTGAGVCRCGLSQLQSWAAHHSIPG
jgi:hypothetical protein